MQAFYFVLAIVTGILFTACTNENQSNAAKSVDTQKMSGAEILADAKTYADQQCAFLLREKALKNEPELKDFDRKMKALNLEKKKAKNFYQKKYDGLPEERIAFQKAVKAARQDAEPCRNRPPKKITTEAF